MEKHSIPQIHNVLSGKTIFERGSGELKCLMEKRLFLKLATRERLRDKDLCRRCWKNNVLINHI
jgi:hypothetical protein